MNAYASYPVTSGGSGVPVYANLAAFPTAASAGNGALAIALDTHVLYESDGTNWLAIGSPGAALSIGTFDSGSASANGAHIDTNALIMQSASATVPGLVNIGIQTFAGNKTFSGAIAASNLSGTNTGDVTLTAVGAAPSANAASLSGQALTLQPADATHPGVVTIGAQSWAGDKTFTGNIAAANFSGSSSGGNTGDVTLTAVGAAPSANGASLSGQALTLQPADGTHPGVLTAADWNTFNNKVSTARTISTTAPLTGGGDLSANRVLAIPVATSLADGYLSAADWSTFNAKGSGSVTSVGVSGGTTGLTTSGGPITGSGTIALAGTLVLANGGTNKNMTATAGGIVWTDADSMEVTAAGTSGQWVTSTGTTAPTWNDSTSRAKTFTAGIVFNGGGTNLNNYGESTWTPVLTIAGGNGTSSITTVCRYTQIGNRVFLTGFVTYSRGATPGTGAVTLTVPIATTNISNFFQTITVYASTGVTVPANRSVMNTYIAANSTTLILVFNSTNGGANTQVLATDLANGTELVFGGNYQI